MSRRVLLAVIFGGAALWSCTARPRPASLTQLAEARLAPASQDARKWAPQAHARALLLERQANDAFEDGDAEATDILSEGALASHEHAWVLAQLAQGEERRLKAQTALEEVRTQLAQLKAQQQKLAAEALSLETRARIAAHSSSTETLDKAGPNRRLARHRAAGSLATAARLLCVSARLLGVESQAAATLLALDQLEASLSIAARPEHLQRATELRAKCLKLLSGARVSEKDVSSTLGKQGIQLPADALLAEFSSAGWSPSRDEKGVILPLDELFLKNGKLRDSSLKSLHGVARAASRRGQFPLLLIGHSSRRGQEKMVQAQLQSVKSVLEKAGAGKVLAMNAGLRQPLIPRGAPGSRVRNQRLELVFVSPTW